MKNMTSLFFVVLILNSYAFAQNFELSVKVKDYPADSSLKLGRYYQAKTYLVDSLKYDNKTKSFVLKRDTLFEGGMYMLVSYENSPAEIVIDKNQNFSIEANYSDHHFSDLKFINSNENTVYQSFNKKNERIYTELDEINKSYKAITEREASEKIDLSNEKNELIERNKILSAKLEETKRTFMQDYPEHIMTAVFRAQNEIVVPEPPADITEDLSQKIWKYEYYYNHFFDNFDLKTDDRLIRTPVFHNKLQYYIEKVLPPHPDTIKFVIERLIEQTRGNDEYFKYVVWYAVDYYQRSQIVGYDAIWIYLAKKYYLPKADGTPQDAYWASEGTVTNFTNRIATLEPLLIGNIPKEFACPDTNINTSKEKFISVFEPSKKHRYTVVIIWEPSCGHCRKKVPELRDLYNSLKDSLDFEVYAVGRDHDIEEWKEFIYKNNIQHWVNVCGKTATIDYSKEWDVVTTPTIVVLDDKHRIVTKKIEPDQIPIFIRQWNELRYEE
jgi:thiol-disulfide isomerase/thioredoxin